MQPKKMIQCGLFSALIAVGAFLRIPLPHVPVTLQTLFVLLSGLVLGKNYGAVPSLVYLLLGLMGLPIFTGGGGIGYVLHPTFGYLLGFVAAGWVMGRVKSSRLFLIALTGLLVIYLFGAVYYFLWALWYTKKVIAFTSLLTTCILTTLPTDLALAALAAMVAKRLKRL